MFNVILLYAIVMFINIFLVFSFFIRLVGVETQRWSTSLSIFQIVNLLPRFIGVLQVPLITLYTETAIKRNDIVSTYFYQGIILFALIGIICGMFLLPLFLNAIKKIINTINEKESFRILLKRGYWIMAIENFQESNYIAFYETKKILFISNRKLFYSNFFASFMLSIALPACVLAGFYIPTFRATIISLVSIFYGFSSVITILLIDTRLSVMTDNAFHGKIDIVTYKIALFDCLKGKVCGIGFGILVLPIFVKFLIYSFKLVL